jgi:ABC-type transporter Mla maintaining outer membrane lipid asymmetry ATPase subunit MlaF
MSRRGDRFGVVLRDVTTRWPGGEPIRLDDIAVGAGRRLAIVGAGGAGMSTLAAVLLRILDYRGSITFNGMELRDLTGDVVRRIVGHCGQDARVIDATVAENVRIARPGASDAELAEALSRAFPCPEELAEAAGYLSPGDLSGGAGWARQRIALARALLADVPVLVIDEPAAIGDVPGGHLAADALLIDLLTATAGRTVLLTIRRSVLPGGHPVLRYVDEVISAAAPDPISGRWHAGGRLAALHKLSRSCVVDMRQPGHAKSCSMSSRSSSTPARTRSSPTTTWRPRSLCRPSSSGRPRTLTRRCVRCGSSGGVWCRRGPRTCRWAPG